MAAADATNIPKIIWMMWWQGFDHAPHIVKRCYRSWQRHNPDWQLIFIDETNYRNYLNIETILASDNDIKLQAKSDIIRIHLLAQYGGVWVDATCFCCKPLGSWLEDHARHGFFAFDRPERSRVMDAWFIASSQDCYLTAELRKATELYWLSNTHLRIRQSRTLYERFLIKALSLTVGSTQLWFSRPVRKNPQGLPLFMAPFFVCRSTTYRSAFSGAVARRKKNQRRPPSPVTKTGTGSAGLRSAQA